MSVVSDGSYTHITENYYIPKKQEQKVTLSVVTQHSGKNLLNILARLEKEGKKKVASFDQVKNTEVEYAEDEDSNIFITIKRQDSTEFTLFVSTIDGGDKLFFTTLNKLWKNKK